MIEVAVIAGLVLALAAAREASRRAALRRARLRAEAMLDELAAAACARLADRPDGRRTARAVERYATARDRVAQARTPRELDLLVAQHALRRDGAALAARALVGVRDLIAQAVPVRRSA